MPSGRKGCSTSVDETRDRPLIVVSCWELERLTSIPQRMLAAKYVEAILRAGGAPVLLPIVDPPSLRSIVGQACGCVLAGGPDIGADRYGADPRPGAGPSWKQLDDLEVSLVREALLDDVPLLGVCRGLQVLNVACGGSLHQHLPDEVGLGVKHDADGRTQTPEHYVDVSEGSLLARISDRSARLTVNSLHHQAADRVGVGLQVSARAGDGTIEALEDPERDFVLGVQWHAEWLDDRDEHAFLFQALVAAARRKAITRGSM